MLDFPTTYNEELDHTCAARDIIEETKAHIDDGWWVVPLEAGGTAPAVDGWDQLLIGHDDVEKYFADDSNVGIILGPKSEGLTALCLSPIAAAAASYLTPPTSMRFGKTGEKEPSTRMYITAFARLQGVTPTIEYIDPTDGEVLVELMVGSESKPVLIPVPPSVIGDRALQWDTDCPGLEGLEYTPVSLLAETTKLTAFAALVSKHWRKDGEKVLWSDFDGVKAAQALAALLFCAGVSRGDIRRTLVTVGELTKYRKAYWGNLVTTASGKYNMVSKGPMCVMTLETMFGKAVATQLRTWFPFDPNEKERDVNLDPATNAQTRFQLIDFKDLKPSPEPDYLIKGLLPKVGLVTFWGPPKCGKSFLVFDMLLHVALGWEYRKRLTNAGLVVYCAFEGAKGFEKRSAAFRIKHNLDADKDIPFKLMPSRIDLIKDHAALIQSIRQQVGEDVPTAVVLDTLNRSLSGSESSDEDMTGYLNAADAIRETFGCAVIIVHHCGIDGTRPRGHTSLTGAIDCQIAVKRDGAGNVIAEVEYMKEGPEGTVILSKLETVKVGIDADDDDMTSCVVIPVEGEVSKAPATARTTPTEKRFMDLVMTAVNEAGEQVKDTTLVPPGVRAVNRDMLFRYLTRGGFWTDQKEESRRPLLNKHLNNLAGKKAVGLAQEWVWLASHSG